MEIKFISIRNDKSTITKIDSEQSSVNRVLKGALGYIRLFFLSIPPLRTIHDEPRVKFPDISARPVQFYSHKTD